MLVATSELSLVSWKWSNFALTDKFVAHLQGTEIQKRSCNLMSKTTVKKVLGAHRAFGGKEVLRNLRQERSPMKALAVCPGETLKKAREDTLTGPRTCSYGRMGCRMILEPIIWATNLGLTCRSTLKLKCSYLGRLSTSYERKSQQLQRGSLHSGTRGEQMEMRQSSVPLWLIEKGSETS